MQNYRITYQLSTIQIQIKDNRRLKVSIRNVLSLQEERNGNDIKFVNAR